MTFNAVARRLAEWMAASAKVVIGAAVFDKVRAFRAPNSRHPKTRFHKRELSLDELTRHQVRIKNWAEAGGHPNAYPQVFRKTELKRARLGEGWLAEIAVDAKLSASVLVSNYAPDDDELMRQASNRMFVRLIEGLPEQVALRYGYSVQAPSNSPLERARKALEVGDWKLLSDLSAELAKMNCG